MSCDLVTRALAEGRSLAEPALRSHAEACAECAERLLLADALGDPGLRPEPEASPPPLLPALRASEGRLGGLRARSRGLRLGLLAATGLALVLVQLLRPRADLGSYPLLRQLAILGALALVTGVAWGAGLRPLHRGPWPRWQARAWGALLVLAPLAVALLPEAATGHPASQGGEGDDLLSGAVACFLYGTVFALPALALALAVDRTGGRLPGPALGAFLGAALVGNLALQLHCALTHPWHLVAGHASIALALAPAALAWRWLRA